MSMYVYKRCIHSCVHVVLQSTAVISPCIYMYCVYVTYVDNMAIAKQIEVVNSILIPDIKAKK